MYYITLDLEWNQAYAQKALAVQRQLSARLRGEVIQIGAVKLDKNLVPCGSYQVIVKPKFFKKLHRHVSTLTGISQEQMDMGTPLPEAAENFRRWCGKDFVFLTWGPDDIPMLRENFHVHGIAFDWLDKNYDLQRIFAREEGAENKQRSLEYAMEYFDIPQTLPAHDALNDAYFTALVAAKLKVEEGIQSYNSQRGELLLSDVLGDADAGDDGYVTITELVEDKTVDEPACPVCGGAMKKYPTILHSKGQRYTLLFECEKDGKMLESLKLHRNFNETWRAKRTITLANEEKVAEFKHSLDIHNAKRKMKPRKPRRKPHGRTGSEDNQ